MTELSFERIREAQRREKKDTSLTPIEEDFYPSLSTFVKDAEHRYKESPDTEKLRELTNTSKLAWDLFDKREQKIVMKALRAARGAKGKEENMTPEEKKLFEEISASLDGQRKLFARILEGERPEVSQTPKTLLNSNGHKIVLVRVLKDIPRFVGSDAAEHGPFKQNSVVKLPENEAELLLKRNLVEKM